MDFKIFNMKALILFLFISFSSFTQNDKLLHASAGFVSSSVTTAILQHYNVKHGFLIGFGVGTCLGIGKEMYDKFSKRGTSSALDAACSIGGAAFGSITVRLGIPYGTKHKSKRLTL